MSTNVLILALCILTFLSAASAVETTVLMTETPYQAIAGDDWEAINPFSLNGSETDIESSENKVVISYERGCYLQTYYGGEGRLNGTLTIENFPSLNKTTAVWRGEIRQDGKVVGVFRKSTESVNFHPEEGEIIYL